jgi:hypothetical protein
MGRRIAIHSPLQFTQCTQTHVSAVRSASVTRTSWPTRWFAPQRRLSRIAPLNNAVPIFSDIGRRPKNKLSDAILARLCLYRTIVYGLLDFTTNY